jgi:outer membrane protein
MERRRFLMVIGILLLTGGLFTHQVWCADLKVASVDIQRAVNECNAGKEAKKVFAKEMDKYQRIFMDKQKELQTMKESLEKQAPMLNPEARASKEKEFQAKLRESQRWAEDIQNEIKQKGMDMDRTITQGMLRVIQKIGAEDGYNLILANENIVLYASKSIDITDRVIKAFDAQKK